MRRRRSLRYFTINSMTVFFLFDLYVLMMMAESKKKIKFYPQIYLEVLINAIINVKFNVVSSTVIYTDLLLSSSIVIFINFVMNSIWGCMALFFLNCVVYTFRKSRISNFIESLIISRLLL